MAVARITAVPAWHRRAAELIKPVHPRAAREFVRAVDRPGHLAELDADEVRTLVVLLPEDQLVRGALAAIERSEESERQRMARLRERQSRWPREASR